VHSSTVYRTLVCTRPAARLTLARKSLGTLDWVWLSTLRGLEAASAHEQVRVVALWPAGPGA
jgi:hypothetical protein